MTLPDDFVWGVATSAFQIEGSADTDGRGPSIWDWFARQKGAIAGGHTADTACDHYHRFEQDIALLKQLGVGAYRLSISWPRVMPEGTGAVNAAGLGFYDRLIDAVLAAGITPWVTLYHWDYPLALHHRGGWLNPESPVWFERYTRAVVDRLGDRVAHWFTLNEPQIFIEHGYGAGTHAPGLKLPIADQLLMGHHALIAHGLAVKCIRERSQVNPTIGWGPAGRVKCPQTNAPEDLEAARNDMFATEADSLWSNTWFGDPVVLGHYPEDALRAYGKDAPTFSARELETICQPLDFYGVTIYSADIVHADADGQAVVCDREPGFPQTSFNWPIEPDCLYWGPRLLHERYQLPIVISENGMAAFDAPTLDGEIVDSHRIDYTRRHLQALSRAVDDGTPISAYFHWSLLDNFEWAEGYRQRFGLVYVDFKTLKRTPKASAKWYQRVIDTNGASLWDGLPQPSAVAAIV